MAKASKAQIKKKIVKTEMELVKVKKTLKSLASVLDGKPKQHDGQWLSVSKVKTFKECPAKFRYNYIERLPRKTWDFHVFGSFLHEVLEFFHAKRLAGNDLPDNELMTECFKEASKNFSLNNAQKKESWLICKQYLELMAKESKEGTAPEIVGVEDNFYIDIDGKVLLNGFIDRVQVDADGMLHVTDYKTSKHKSFLKKDHMQLKTYAYVKCIEDPSIKKIRTSYILLRHGFEMIVKEYTRDQVLSMEKTFLDYADKIKGEKLWRPIPNNLCKFCDFIENCDEGKAHISDDVSHTYGAVSWG
jgi:putative RecB family exonuclease